MIDGKTHRDALISGANNIAKHRVLVDSLNVFPVPDGDTGTNMSMTFGAAKRELELLEDDSTIEETAKKASASLLRGARGNSGVILSLIFRGMAKGFGNSEKAGAREFVEALEEGVKAAYGAVMKPTEGTMLTVARVAAEKAREAYEADDSLPANLLWDIAVVAAEDALNKTPEQLPVLKKAGVVDAGGKGLLLIYEGMQKIYNGEEGVKEDEESAEAHDMPDERNAAGEFEGEITFTYCTEFIVLKDNEKADAGALRTYLETIGDSVVVVEDEEIIKVHIHTDNPGNAMQKGLESGQLINMKIDNMREQHASNRKAVSSKKKTNQFKYKPVDPSNQFGFVTVAAGEGVESLFRDLSVDNIVSGGQTMNPSTDDILEAIHATPAKNVIVLPNNKNIIMAAEQAEKLADRKVVVLPTKSIPQGLAAMLAFDPEETVDKNMVNMVKASDSVSTGQLTFAARDSSMDGHKINKGEYLALENGKLAFSDKNLEKSVVRLVRQLVKWDSEFVTIIYGEGITHEQAEKIEEAVRAKLPKDIEIALVEGKQPVYYFIISVE